MAVTLKRLVSEAGAGEDKSYASDDSHPDRFTLLSAIVNTQNALVASHNQLVADYNAETAAAHTASTAAVVAAGVEVES